MSATTTGTHVARASRRLALAAHDEPALQDFLTECVDAMAEIVALASTRRNVLDG